MNPYFRYVSMISAALLLGITIYFVSQVKNDDSEMFMGVGGDPRMRLCDSPLNGELAQPDVLAKLNIAAPLVKAENDKAAYRVSVLRPLGQESLSITITTPKSGGGKVKVARWSDGTLTQGETDLDVTDAAILVFAFREARIWDAVKPTIETLKRTGDASSVIEVQTPTVKHCVTTRYDDERVRPLLAAIVKKVQIRLEPMSIAALQPPDPSFLRNQPAKKSDQGQ